MNHHIVPEFNMEDDGYSIPTSSDCFFDQHLKMPEEELVELLWKNGQVVMHNQTQRPPRKTPVRFYHGDGSAVLHHVLPDKSAAEDGYGGCVAGPSSAPGQLLHIQEDEMASWLQYPIDDSFDRDFCSDLFYHPAGSCPPVARPSGASSSSPKPKVPPIPPPDADKVAANFAHFSLLTGKAPQAEPPRVSTSTATTAAPPRADREVGGGDPPVASSSGDWAPNEPAANDRKRKREGDELEGQKELSLRIGCRDDGEKNSEFDHVEEKQPARLARRARAAEVHNLSERRRRDRINEKMKALQELIPHCNKSDKASMLDEAIEYLKSLQFQVQMMSMGCGMAPMVYPGVQHYISPMGMRMGMSMAMDMASGSLNRPMLPFQPVLPPMPIHGVASHLGQRLPIPPLQMPRIPLSDQPRACSTGQTDAAFNLVALQIPNAQTLMNLPDPYQRYLSFHPMPMAPQTETTATGPHTSATTEAPDSKNPVNPS